jgi:hypothetical protein
MNERNKAARRPTHWRGVLWWVALIVLMGSVLALATLFNAE